jgi:hypothetical protein
VLTALFLSLIVTAPIIDRKAALVKDEHAGPVPDQDRPRGVEVLAFPSSRRAVTAAVRAGRRIVPMHGLLDVDVTEARRLLIGSPPPQSMTAFVVAATLLGSVPVMGAVGSDATRSAAGRLAGEATCWLPTAFSAASWTSGAEPDTAVATRRIGDGDEAARIRVAADGRLREVLLDRWGDPDGQPFARYPFGVSVEEERAFSGVSIPSVVRAGWWWGTDRQDAGEFFRAEIIGARFR